MKTKLTLLVCLVLCGCTTVFNSIVTITEIRNNTLNELGRQYRAGAFGKDVYDKIDKADAKYREAALVAQRALEVYKSTGQGDPKLILASVKDTVTSLVDILATYVNASAQYKQLSKATKL